MYLSNATAVVLWCGLMMSLAEYYRFEFFFAPFFSPVGTCGEELALAALLFLVGRRKNTNFLTLN